MKKRNKWLVCGILAAALALSLAGCAGDQSPYPEYDAAGYNVSVKYDCSGGLFADTLRTTMIDVFKPDYGTDGTATITLLAPGSADRGDGATVSIPSNTGYFLAGWYRTRELRFAEDGITPLDAYGEPLTQDENGNWTGEQGYIFSDPWDFETDTVTVSESESHTSAEPVLTLYAAWIPNYTYHFYAQDEEGVWTEYADIETGTVSQRTLLLPEWDAESGAMDYTGNYINSIIPVLEGKTFVSASLTEDFSEALESGFVHPGGVDAEQGIGHSFRQNIYTEWMDGVWYQISNVSQFVKNAGPTRCFQILADLDFTGQVWPVGLGTGVFTGKIIGNGHTFSNITANQTGGTSQVYGGLFGQIAAEARIENISFTNVTYTVSSGSRITDSSFGLFTGRLNLNDEVSPLENVQVSGTLVIGDVVPPETQQTLYGVFSGNLVSTGATYDIDCVCRAYGYNDYGQQVEIYPFILNLNPETGRITLTANPNPEVDPNGASA